MEQPIKIIEDIENLAKKAEVLQNKYEEEFGDTADNEMLKKAVALLKNSTNNYRQWQKTQ